MITNHKENGTELQSKWCWHLQKANMQYSDPRVHDPEECSKAKEVENCRYTIAPTRERLKMFFAQLFLLISSVFTEQSKTCVKNVTPAMIEQGDLLWKDNLTHCSCQVWWRHTYFWPMILHNKKKIYWKDKERIEKLSQQDRLSKFCTDARFLTTVEVGRYFMAKDTKEFSQFTDSVVCREYTLPRDESLSEPKGWIREKTKIGPVLEVTTCCLQGKYGVEIRIGSMNKDILTRGSEFLMASISWSQIWATRRTTTMSRKPLRCSSKTMRWKRMYERQKENHKDVLLPAHPQELYLLVKELGPILNHKIIRSPFIQCRRNWSIFFVMEVYLEKTMERLNSGELRIIFKTILCIPDIGPMKRWRLSWQEEEETRKYFSIVLILQEKFFTSELFKVIQDAILLIVHYRTMY